MENKITVDDVMKSVRGILGDASIKDECFFKLMMEHRLEMSDDAVIDWKFCEPKTWKEIRDKYMTSGIVGTDNVVCKSLGLHTLNSNNSQPEPHELFKSITEGMLEVFKRKNADYGNSFDKSLNENGLIAAKVRMEDKMNRFGNLIKNPQQVSDETVEDTLLDLANYAIMTVMWNRGQNKQMIMDLWDGGKTFTYNGFIIEAGTKVMIKTSDGGAKGPYKVDKVVRMLTFTPGEVENRYFINGKHYGINELLLYEIDEAINSEEVYVPYINGEHVKVTGGFWCGEEGVIESIKCAIGQQPKYTLKGLGGVWFQHNDLIVMESNSPSKQHTAGSYLEPLAVDDYVMYLDMLKKSPSVGKVSEVLTIPGARPEVKYRVNGALYVRTDLIKVNMPEHHELFAFKGGVK